MQQRRVEERDAASSNAAHASALRVHRVEQQRSGRPKYQIPTRFPRIELRLVEVWEPLGVTCTITRTGFFAAAPAESGTNKYGSIEWYTLGCAATPPVKTLFSWSAAWLTIL